MNGFEHYEQLLAPVYDWMTGDFNARQLEEETILRSMELQPKDERRAVDFGAGHGLHSISFARMGYEVTAVDFNRYLLDQLVVNAGDIHVRPVLADINSYTHQLSEPLALVSCMGDTILHLERAEDVESLFRRAFDKLMPGGSIVLSFRDLAETRTGAQRFIPVRQDENRILTCFLEYGEDRITVNDILHERNNDVWTMRVSSYAKLRLSKETLENMLTTSGLSSPRKQLHRGVHYWAASKP